MEKAVSDMPYHPGRSGAKSGNPLEKCRILLAKMLGIKNKDRIVLCSNSTYALNLAIHGYPFRQKGRIITSAMEHNSVLRTVNHRAQRDNLEIIIIPVDKQGRIITSQYLKELKNKKTDMVVLNHASNVTGIINEIKPLFKEAKEAGAVTLLDASQSMGYIPFTADELYADMIAFTGHKSLLGPPGTGGLYVDESISLNPVIVGGTGVRSDLLFQPEDMPVRLEAGTPAIPNFAGLAHALEWKNNKKSDNKHVNSLLNYLEEGIKEIAGVNVISVDPPRTPVISFTLKNWDVEEGGYILQESFGIICRSGLHCAPLIHKYIGTAPRGSIRFSLSLFNTKEEVDYAIDSLRKLAS